MGAQDDRLLCGLSAKVAAGVRDQLTAADACAWHSIERAAA